MEDTKNPSLSSTLPPPPPPPIEDPQPAAKKPKMSTTTTDDDEERENLPAGERPHRYKRRKVAIFFAYCGVGYQGMQKNPGAKTIEGDLEEALYKAGAVPESDRGQPKRFDWARSARTDKGVSAVGQVVSGRFYVDPPGFVDRLNANLSPQIRIFGFKRATASFNAKKFCDRRRYVYLLPVFALDPTCHRDRESVLASLGSGNELSKCLECSERGRKVVGLMGNKRNIDAKVETLEQTLKTDVGVGDLEVLVQSGISSNSEAALLTAEGREEEKEREKEQCNEVKGVADLDSNDVSTEAVNVEEGMNGSGNGEEGMKEERSEFKYGDEVRERFNKILKYYEGTHNFHNFTTRTKAEDPAAKRYIVSFDAKTTFTVEGIEFVKCEVVGQSFMLHQIRKMMGLAVSVMRGFAPESIYETAFDQDVHFNVPTAPEVGLYLDECFFTSYNNKWKNSHEELSMKDYAKEAEEFKLKHIYSHIANTEHKEGAVAVWLHSLNHRNYPDLRPVDGGAVTTVERENNGVETMAEGDPTGITA